MHTKPLLAFHEVHAQSYLPQPSVNTICCMGIDMGRRKIKQVTALFVHHIVRVDVFIHRQEGRNENFGSCTRCIYMCMHVLRSCAIAWHQLLHMQVL